MGISFKLLQVYWGQELTASGTVALFKPLFLNPGQGIYCINKYIMQSNRYKTFYMIPFLSPIHFNRYVGIMKELLADDFYYLMTSIDRGNDLDNTLEIQMTYRKNSTLSHGKVQELFGKGLMI